MTRTLRLILALAVLLVFAMGIHFGGFAAGGADSYGYVSQAGLWLKGNLRIEQPWVKEMSWPNREYSFAPLGYRPLGADGTIVPTYSPGLPMLMAIFLAIFGANGPFYVVPLLGALGVWLTYQLGREVTGSAAAGVGAALLVSSSPAYLAQLMLPMTDVPVAVGWTLVAVLALRDPRPRAFGAGLAAGASLLIRPNLVLLPLAPVAGWLWPCVWRQLSWRTGIMRVMRFGLGMTPALIAIGAINKYLYGSPLASGYGNLGELFGVRVAPQNLGSYGLWLIQSQTPLVALALVPMFAPRALRHDERDSSAPACLVSFIVLAVVSYLFYTPFNHWLYVRFLLPAFPALFVLMAAGVRFVCGKLPTPARAPAAVLVLAVCVVSGFLFARGQSVFAQRAFEQRYVRAARYVDELTPPNAVIFSMQHSGSVRYYAHRITLRYDWLFSHRLDTTLRELREKGYRSYIVLDDLEETQFRNHFAKQNRAGSLDWRPIVRVVGSPEVHIYDPEGRFEVLPGAEVK